MIVLAVIFSASEHLYFITAGATAADREESGVRDVDIAEGFRMSRLRIECLQISISIH
jgi:hypothetical protein